MQTLETIIFKWRCSAVIKQEYSQDTITSVSKLNFLAD